MRLLLFVLALTGFGAALAAEEKEASLRISDDVFRAGQEVVHDQSGADDLFMAGETVRSNSEILGSAHLAGRRVEQGSAVGEDLYAAGMRVTSTGAIGGDATVAGYNVKVGPVAGDLRATGSTVALTGDIGGYALVATEELQMGGAIGGDAYIAAEEISFDPGAKIEGQLVLYERNVGSLKIPETVVPADRIERRNLSEWDHDIASYRVVSWWAVLGRFLLGLIVVTGMAALAAALLPEQLANVRQRLLEQPLRALWFGFLTQAALIGATVLLAMTLIGILVSPATVLLAILSGLAGYIVGVYAFGVGIMQRVGRGLPEKWSEKAIAAVVGAVLAGLIGLIPFFGWLFVLALTLVGIGAIALQLFRPQFFATA